MAGGEYEVESILLARVKAVGRGKRKEWEYCVKWVGYDDPKENTWEPKASFKGSEQIIDAFWARIYAHKKDNINDYPAGTEVFPTGPPRKKGKKPAPPPTPSASSTPTTEVVEDSEVEVRSIIDDEETPSTRRKRPSSPIPQQEALPTKRVRRKSERASAASPAKAAVKRRRSNKQLSPSNKDEVSASSSKRNGVSRRRSLGDSSASDPQLPKMQKKLALSRFAPVGHESSVVSETPANSDNGSDIDQVLQLAGGLAKEVEGGSSRNDVRHDLDDMYHNPFPEERSSLSPAAHKHPIRPSGSPLTAAPGTLQTVTVIQNMINPSQSNKGTILGLFAKPPSGQSSRGFTFLQAGLSNSAGPSRAGRPPAARRDVSPAAAVASASSRTASSPLLAHQRRHTDDSVVDEVSAMADGCSEDAEGEVDEELLAQDDPVLTSMQVDVAMEQLGDPAISHNAEIDAPAKEPEHVDVPDVPMVPANEHAISPVITTAWNNTIFGPLGLGRSFQSMVPEEISTPDQRPACSISLANDLRLTLLLENIHSAADGQKPLGQALSGGSNFTPGKFYKGESAVAISKALHAQGSFAKGVLGEGAPDGNKEHFERFLSKLADNALYFVSFGVHTVAICSSTAHTLGQQLGISPGLFGLDGDYVVITEVTVSDDDAYFRVALDPNADVERW